MTFKLISPQDPKRLEFLLARYDPPFYSDLEASFRAHGYSKEADEIFISRKRAERGQACPDLLRQCDRRGAFA